MWFSVLGTKEYTFYNANKIIGGWHTVKFVRTFLASAFDVGWPILCGTQRVGFLAFDLRT